MTVETILSMAVRSDDGRPLTVSLVLCDEGRRGEHWSVESKLGKIGEEAHDLIVGKADFVAKADALAAWRLVEGTLVASNGVAR